MRQRIDYIVFLRVLCTIGVLINHVPLVASHVFSSKVSSTDVLVTSALVHLAHFAVPVFVMITGALLLDPSRQISFGKAVKKYVWRMIVVLFTIGWFFAIMEYYSTFKEVSFSLFSCSLLNVLSGKTWTHMWYLYMLVGLYLVIPFLKSVVEKSPQSVMPFIIILFVFTSITPTLHHFLGIQLGFSIPIDSYYVLYLLLGFSLSFQQSNLKVHPLIVLIPLQLFLLLCSYIESWGGGLGKA